MIVNSRHIQHLYWRAGFGLSPLELKHQFNNNRKEIIDELIYKSKDFIPLEISFTEINNFKKTPKIGTKARQRFSELNNVKLKAFNYAWVYRLVESNQVLREKMTLFWANHFVCKDNHIKSVQQFNNTLRKHALGNFKDFVKAISRESSMIKYLNLNSNNKKKPNENFARELLELFTLGLGNYTEKDITEAARAFTGYNTNFNSEFVFKRQHHDFGKKEFLGKKGVFDGDDIIDIILQNKACANFICSKLYRCFVNEDLNSAHVQEMTEVFYKDYDIEKVIRFLFNQDWFYKEENIGTKIKSPIELIVGMHKAIPLHFNSQDELLKIQDVLDQKLLYPPNVSGWKGGRNWINTNSMLVRVKLPSMVLERETYTLKPKGNFTKNFKFEYIKNKYQDKLDVTIDWKAYRKQSKQLEEEDLLQALILSNLSTGTKSYLRSLGKLTKKRNLSKIMALPEYQMC